MYSQSKNVMLPTTRYNTLLRVMAGLLLTAPVIAGYQVYKDGEIVADCAAPATTSPPPSDTTAPPSNDPTFGTILFSRTGNSDGSPINGQVLYDQALLAPGTVYLEVLTTGQSIHHMVWYDNGTKIRRENVIPYTTSHTLTTGRHQIAAALYSSESKLIGTYRVEFYVGDGGAAVGSGSGDIAGAGEPPAPETPLVKVTVMWTPPSTRENGDPLALDEIALYYLNINESSYTVAGSQSSYSMELPTGDYVATMIAEDTTGLRSAPSSPYPFRL